MDEELIREFIECGQVKYYGNQLSLKAYELNSEDLY